MTQTLNSNSFTARCLHVIAVDEDGTTIRDFKGGIGLSVSPSVSFGTSVWAGVQRPFFETKPNGFFNGFAVDLVSGVPSIPFNTSAGMFMVISDYVSGAHFLGRTDLGLSLITSAGVPTVNQFTLAAVTITNPATRYSYAFDYHDGGPPSQAYYGVDGTSITVKGAQSCPEGFAGAQQLSCVGAVPGQGRVVAKWHLLVVTSGALTTVEANNLHNDWYTYLFTSAGGSVGGGGAGGFRPWYTRSMFLVTGRP